MAYREAAVPYNLRSAVQAAYDWFRDLAWDADHEAVYGMDYFDAEWCRESAKRYRRARDICYEYLDYKICKQCLVRRLEEMDFDSDDIKKFLNDTNDEKCNSCQ